MVNIIGLIDHRTNQKVMVNADQIIYFRTVVQDAGTVEPLIDPRFAEGEQVTEILLVGGAYLLVREGMYQIAEMIDAAGDIDCDSLKGQVNA